MIITGTMRDSHRTERIDLTGPWNVSCPARRITFQTNIPFDIYAALHDRDLIPDPFRAQNEKNLRWVGQEDWEVERSFEITPEFLAFRSIYLNLDVLDTIGTIFINGKKVLETASAFVRWRPQIGEYLVAGWNQFRIQIRSAERAALQAAGEHPYPLPFTQFPVQSPCRNFIRKNQSHAGWDWGPCLMTAGISGEVYLGATTLLRIEHIYTAQAHLDGNVELQVFCEVTCECEANVTLEVILDGESHAKAVALVRGANTVDTAITIRSPRLWWPRGYGEQPLYDLEVNIGGDNVARKIGLRTISLVNEADEAGRSFYFEVNGIAIFAKGANWIPADALPSRVNQDRVRDLLSSAARAHMNMIRVWGGGQYEPDYFYDICDELGLLVWQDFMFSCALYPATAEFLDLVRQEARFQIKRLRHHACLALWCGDNENLGAINWFSDNCRQKRDRNLADWAVLNKGVLRECVRKYDPERICWPSSPCGGEDDYSDCWTIDSVGDMHYWDAWIHSKPFTQYHEIRPRFCSEFGHQSFPSMELVRSFLTPDQCNLGAPDFEYHQRDTSGNGRLLQALLRHFRMPKSFEQTLYVSQVTQGLAIRTAVEHFRRLRPRCMGSLYWQLNDVWPASSWSSIEYGGKWKLLHYMARRFFHPVLLSAREASDGTLEVWLVNDSLKTVEGTLTATIMRLDGEPVQVEQHQVNTGREEARCVVAFRLSDPQVDRAEVFLSLHLETATDVWRNELFFVEPKHCNLPESRILTEVEETADGMRICISTDKPAYWVALETERIRGEFEDNAFLLLPDQPRHLLFTPEQKVDIAQFRAAVRVNHLRNSYD